MAGSSVKWDKRMVIERMNNVLQYGTPTSNPAQDAIGKLAKKAIAAKDSEAPAEPMPKREPIEEGRATKNPMEE